MQCKSVDRRENISDRITKHSVLEIGQRTAIEVKRKKNKIKQQQQFHATQTVDCYGAVSRSVVMHARLMVFVMSYERMQPNENRNIVMEIAYDAIHHANWIRWWSDWVTIRVVQSSAHRTVEPFEYFRSTICVDSICFFVCIALGKQQQRPLAQAGQRRKKTPTNRQHSLVVCLRSFAYGRSLVKSENISNTINIHRPNGNCVIVSAMRPNAVCACSSMPLSIRYRMMSRQAFSQTSSNIRQRTFLKWNLIAIGGSALRENLPKQFHFVITNTIALQNNTHTNTISIGSFHLEFRMKAIGCFAVNFIIALFFF